MKLAENNQRLAELKEMYPPVFKQVSRVSQWLIAASLDLEPYEAPGIIFWNYTVPVVSAAGANFDLLSRVRAADSKP